MPNYIPTAMQVFMLILLVAIGILLVGIVFALFAKGAMELYSEFKRSELYKDMFGGRPDV